MDEKHLGEVVPTPDDRQDYTNLRRNAPEILDASKHAPPRSDETTLSEKTHEKGSLVGGAGQVSSAEAAFMDENPPQAAQEEAGLGAIAEHGPNCKESPLGPCCHSDPNNTESPGGDTSAGTGW